PYEIDFEAWHSSLEGLVAFMRFLIEDLKLGSCIFLSGDVHYGMNLHFTFAIGDDEVRITQLVSSGQKHSGTLSRSGLQLLGRLVRARHERVGWRSPPDVPSLGAAKHRFLARSVNTDEWTEDSPVFLSPGLAGRLGIEKPPDFREARSYVKPPGDRSMLVGENNVGVVQLQGNRVVHRISSRGTRGTVVHEAALDVFQEDLQKAAQARDRR
ncbi:MAG: hypothetical protein ACRDJ5_11030, partial [Actinomycetota bacterium]